MQILLDLIILAAIGSLAWLIYLVLFARPKFNRTAREFEIELALTRLELIRQRDRRK